MALFTKTLLKVGETLKSPDGDVPITVERLRNFADQHKRLKDSGYEVPSRWEHSDSDYLPLSKQQLTQKLDGRHAVGKMVDFRLSPNGQNAELILEVTDKRAIEQCESNRVKISPVISEWWKDGHGNEYCDLITHADLVERPVDFTQSPFVPLTNEPTTVALSLEKFVSKKVVRMALENQEENEGKNDGISENENPKPQDEQKGNPDMPPITEAKDPKLEAVIAGMGQLGVVVPSDWSIKSDSAIDILLAAINSAIAAKNQIKQDSEAKEETEDEPTVASPGYTGLSTEQRSQVEYAQKLHRESICRELDSLLENGKCSPTEYQNYKAKLGSIRLSLDAQGNPIPSAVEQFIEIRKPTKRGSVWEPDSKTALSTEAAEIPKNLQSSEETNEIAEQNARLVHSRTKR